MRVAELFSVARQGAVVTGAGSGLGLAIAEGLAENGAYVTLLDIDGDRIATETERLKSQGFAVRGEVVDVSDHPQLERAFDAAVAAHGRLDIVFANAGIDSGPGFISGWSGSERARNPDGALESYSNERWNRVIDVNLTGVALSVNAFPPVIAEMARGSYPLEGWVETIPFEGVIEQGLERLRRQQGMKIVVDVAGESAAGLPGREPRGGRA